MNLQYAYILHRYPYRETSFLLKLFTREEGLITVVARNAKRPRSDWYGLLQAFQTLTVRYQGRGSVLTLTQAERAGPLISLHHQTLWAGFYVNELLLKFLAPHDVHRPLFEIYHATLLQLNAEGASLEKTLRSFELNFFAEMGLLPDFSTDDEGNLLEQECLYQLERQHLPKKIACPPRLRLHHFRGAELIALREQDFTDPQHLKTAKRFSRLWLEFYGLGRTIQTREIFAAAFQELTV